jgi:hypothetical protein
VECVVRFTQTIAKVLNDLTAECEEMLTDHGSVVVARDFGFGPRSRNALAFTAAAVVTT